MTGDLSTQERHAIRAELYRLERMVQQVKEGLDRTPTKKNTLQSLGQLEGALSSITQTVTGSTGQCAQR
jgi:hypothetical protein